MAEIHVGTSGWHYRHWIGPFYPAGMAPREFFPFYARRFSAVEIDSTFYSLPKAKTLTNWREIAPPDFVFACKASRYITHMKKLKDAADTVPGFLDGLSLLGEKLGPVLFQLPPHWAVNVERLESFLEALRPGGRYVFEFRDVTWFTGAVYRALEEHEAAFCIHDFAGRQSPMAVTAGFVYLRLHGPEEAYRGSYSEEALRDYANRLLRWRARGLEAYCFLDNDENGYAALDAMRLKEMLEAG
jgi:uncharacterized protein YecE (DUF72 family)